MKHLVAAGVAVLAVTASASAQGLDAPSQYSMEAEIIIADGELGLGFDYYFTPVDNDSNPYAVQPFMQRASRVGVDLGFIQLMGFPPAVGGLDDVGISIPVVYTLPVLDKRLQIIGDIYDLTDKADDDNLPWAIAIGVYALDNLRVSTDVISKMGDDVEAGLNMIDVEAFLPDQKLGLELAFVLDDFGDYYKIGASYYPMKELGINFDILAGDMLSDTHIEIGADYVLGPVVLGASYRTEVEVFTFDAKVRF